MNIVQVTFKRNPLQRSGFHAYAFFGVQRCRARNSSTSATVMRIWEIPAMPEMAAFAPVERGVCNACKMPRTKNMITIKGRATA